MLMVEWLYQLICFYPKLTCTKSENSMTCHCVFLTIILADNNCLQP